MPKVSVIVPFRGDFKVYNLLRALERQTFDDFEVIIADDSKHKFKFDTKLRLRHFYFDKPVRIAEKINFMVKQAKADFIAITDSDCVPVNTWLEELLGEYEDENTIIRGAEIEHPLWFSHANLFAHKSLFENTQHNTDLKIADDTDFYFNLKRNGVKIKRTNKALVNHYKNTLKFLFRLPTLYAREHPYIYIRNGRYMRLFKGIGYYFLASSIYFVTGISQFIYATYYLIDQQTKSATKYLRYLLFVEKIRGYSLLGKRYLLSLFFSITDYCNLRCIMCRKYKNRHHLDFNVIKKAILAERSKYLQQIGFTGGEPFIRDDMGDILNWIHDNTNANTFIISNFTLTDRVIEQVKKIKDKKRNLFITSIDGNEETHDRIRGRGNYRKTIATIKKLKAMGCRIEINVCVLQENYDQILDVYFLGKRLGVENVKCVLAFPREDFPYTDMQIMKIKEQIDKMIHKELKLSNAAYYYSLDTQFTTVGCYGSKHYFSIDANGDIYSCEYSIHTGEPMGNLYKTSIDEISYKKTKCLHSPPPDSYITLYLKPISVLLWYLRKKIKLR